MTSAMFIMQGLHRALLGLAILFVFTPAYAEPAAIDSAKRYPSGTISTTDNADRALADAAFERAAVEQRYASEQGECYSRFFATACMEDAKERRRKALAEIRVVEVEANEYKRKARVAERDRALTKRLADSEVKQVENVQQMQETGGKPRSHTHGDDAMPPASHPPSSANTNVSLRVSRQEAKMRRLQAEGAANAAKRAANIAAYERKQREAQEHQEEVENRKADKERERLRKQASNSAFQ